MKKWESESMKTSGKFASNWAKKLSKCIERRDVSGALTAANNAVVHVIRYKKQLDSTFNKKVEGLKFLDN